MGHRFPVFRVAVVLLGLWIGVLIWWGRYYYIDDALIGLRYADLLRAHGFVTFDGLHPSYGTSSLLYVGLLAVVGGILPSIFLPKLLSIVAYVILLGITLGRALKADGMAQSLWCMLLVFLASPMGGRWFTDGMETSLATMLALVLGYWTFPIKTWRARLGQWVVPWVLAYVCVFVRVEEAFLIAFLGLGNAAYAYAPASPLGRKTSLIRSLMAQFPLASGAGLGLLTVRLMTGSVLSDAAVAKADGFQSLSSYAVAFLGTFAASLSLGVGLLLLWVLAGVLAWMHADRLRLWALGAVNFALPGEVLLSMLRGQRIEGVRYFLPTVALMIAWDLAFLARCQGHPAPHFAPGPPHRPTSRINVALACAMLLLMICEWVVEGHLVNRIFQTHGASLQAMRNQRLEEFAGQKGVASDIGFISYFTRASMCDTGGLVNGRQFAMMSGAERVRRCAAASPAFAFVNAEQRAELSQWIPLEGWTTCHAYEFDNAFHDDPHWLMVRPDVARKTCSESGSTTSLH